MARLTKGIYAVITADIVGSRGVTAFREKRDRILASISKEHLRKRLVLSQYAVTAWDEFQVILSRPSYVPEVIFDLRRLFYPLHLWVASGIGRVTEPRRRPINLYAGGEAFERAREIADLLKGSKGTKFPVMTGIKSNYEQFDKLANTIYHLHDTLVRNVSAKQWKLINLIVSTGQQDVIAKKLGVHESTVSRTLQRGFYWQMVETRETMAEFIERTFSR